MSKCAGPEPGWKLSAHGKKENRSQQKRVGKGVRGRKGRGRQEGERERGGGKASSLGQHSWGQRCPAKKQTGLWPSGALRSRAASGVLWTSSPGRLRPRTDGTGALPPCLSSSASLSHEVGFKWTSGKPSEGKTSYKVERLPLEGEGMARRAGPWCQGVRGGGRGEGGEVAGYFE